MVDQLQVLDLTIETPNELNDYMELNDDFYRYELSKSLSSPLNIRIASRRYRIGIAREIDVHIPSNVDHTITFDYCFYRHKQLYDISRLSTVDTSHVTTMHGMFYGCTELLNFNLQYISVWNTSKCMDMSTMFCECNRLFDFRPLESWKIHPNNSRRDFHTLNHTSRHPMINGGGRTPHLLIYHLAYVTDTDLRKYPSWIDTNVIERY